MYVEGAQNRVFKAYKRNNLCKFEGEGTGPPTIIREKKILCPLFGDIMDGGLGWYLMHLMILMSHHMLGC